MKKIALLALLFVAASAQVQAQDEPIHVPHAYANYTCTYTNPTMYEKSPGWSIFKIDPVYPDYSLIRGIEDYQATHQWGQDNRKVAFFEPRNRVNAQGDITWTRWRFKVNPSGPECTVLVTNYGRNLSFFACTDGHSRTCQR